MSVLEGGLADEELVRQDAEAPQVDLLGVAIVAAAGLEHLRREVVEGAAHSFAAVVGRVDGPAEVADLDLAVNTDEDVLRFDVPVHDVLLVEIFERRGHLGDVLRGFPLGEPLLPPEVLVQLALPGELQDQEDPFTVVEMAEQSQDIRVSEV